MPPLLFLEPLEDRALPSGLNAGEALQPRPDPLALASQFRPYSQASGIEARVIAASSPRANAMTASDVDALIGLLDPREKSLYPLDDDFGSRRRPDSMELSRLVDIEAVGDLVAIEKSGLGDGGLKNGLYGTREGHSSQAQSALPTYSPADLGTLAQSSAFATSPSGQSSLVQDAIFSLDGTAEMAAPGPLSDTVLLDAWQDGIPPPSTVLVPLADKDLTIIAAYLVGSPTKQGVAEVSNSMNQEIGLTDFIVGYQNARSDRLTLRTELRSDDGSTPRMAGESKPVVLDRVAVAPPSAATESSAGDVCDDAPREERTCPQEGQQEIGPVDGDDEA